MLQRSIDDGVAQKQFADERAATAMRSAFATAYGADRLRPAVARVLADTLSEEDARAALAWLTTDLGRRITSLEEAAAERAPPERTDEIAAALPPARRALFVRLSSALHAGEVAATVLINMTWGLARGAEIASPGSARQADDIRAALEGSRARIVAQVERQMVGVNAVTYASLTDEEIERYIAFAESPAGGRYHAATSIALERALSDASIEAGRILASSRST